MLDVFSNKRIDYDAISDALGMIFKIKTSHTSELQ